MSNIQLIIEERAASIGNFMVGRLLPFRQKRMVGPFIFIDHMGPAEMSNHENFDVGPHPHIGLSTLTYLFEGSILHRDSLNNVVEIKPGAVNWMTAGKGIVHSERTPAYLRHTQKRMHGLQIWVALPKELEQMEPEFFHIEQEAIPEWKDGDALYKLIAGEAFGKRSPVPVYSKLFMLEIKSNGPHTLNIGAALYGESGIYILQGGLQNNGHRYGARQILVANDSTLCSCTVESDSIIYIFGGDAFPEERFIYWNFVASSHALIDNAKQSWQDQTMGTIEGETDFIPLPPPVRGMR